MRARLDFLFFTAAMVTLIAVANLGQAGNIWQFVGMIPYGDKLGHVVLVGTLTVLLNRWLKGGTTAGLMLGSRIVLAVMLLEEASQYFIPARSFDLFDALANAIGVISGEGLLRMWLAHRTVSATGSGRAACNGDAEDERLASMRKTTAATACNASET